MSWKNASLSYINAINPRGSVKISKIHKMAMEKTKLEILQHLGFLPKIDEVSFYQDQIILVKVGHCVTNTFGHQHPSPISRLLIFP